VHLLFSKLTPFDPVENDISFENKRDLLIHLYKGVVPVFFDIFIKVGIFCEISRSFLVFGFK
jgi:hypothetical protein